jgi:cbb3-type cytochrome oxidase maturation protein
MKIIFLLIIISLIVALGFLGAFLWAVRSGQYDDEVGPAMRMLFDEEPPQSDNNHNTSKKS